MGLYSKKIIRDLDKALFPNMFTAGLLKIASQVDSALMSNRRIVHLNDTLLRLSLQNNFK